MVVQLTYFRNKVVVARERYYIFPRTIHVFLEMWRNLHFLARDNFPPNSDSYSLKVIKK